MFLATVNLPKQLLYLSLIGEVRADELANRRENLVQIMAGLEPGFRLLTDLSLLESFDPECSTEIGKNMHLFEERGVGLVVRVIPDASKDIGLNIISLFHYTHVPNTVTCSSMVEAAKVLSL